VSTPERSAWRATLDAALARYQALPRAGGDAWAILEGKLATALARQQAVEARLALADDTALQEDLIAVGARLSEDQKRRAKARLSTEAFAGLLAAQGERAPGGSSFDLRAGPAIDLKIQVNRDSPWPFERWRMTPEFAAYEMEGDRVFYRGLWLQPGDLLLPNVNLDGNFVYSALSDPKGFCPHSAIFALLDYEGQRFPAVVETYEKGLRAVPLCVFLNDRYISYAEVYRHRELLDGAPGEASALAHSALAEARGYNFNTVDDDRAYLCCTSQARQFYQRLGLADLEAVGRVAQPGIRANFEVMKYPHLDAFFTPIDFIRSDRFVFQGSIDNQQPERLITRELVERRFRERFAAGGLNWDRVPLMVKGMHYGIKQMRKETALGRLISKVMGFTPVNLPKGPDRVLAIVEPLEAELGRAVRRLVPEVRLKLQETQNFSLRSWLEDPTLRQRVDDLLPLRWLGDGGLAGGCTDAGSGVDSSPV